MVELKNSTTILKLNTGAEIPAVALGTWKSSEEDAYNAVLTALKAGYRHIDTAAIYQNEAPVGKAIRDSGIPREEIFVTTKLWGSQQRNPLEGLDQSLERLGLSYVDLYLMHWPVPLKKDPSNPITFTTETDMDGWDFIKTWTLMQELPATGKTKAIGVSNFSINNIKQLIESEDFKILPAANQVEIHPLLPQQELIDYCQEKGIIVEAYSPLGSEAELKTFLTNPTILKIAEKYGVEPAQVLINWGVKRGYVILPKSANPKRVESNFKEFDLSQADVDAILCISKELGEKRVVSPKFGSFPLFE